jgi:hypothetical protein
MLLNVDVLNNRVNDVKKDLLVLVSEYNPNIILVQVIDMFLDQ